MTFLYCLKMVRISQVVFFYSHNKIKRALWENGASMSVLNHLSIFGYDSTGMMVSTIHLSTQALSKSSLNSPTQQRGEFLNL